jgi:hypothetical protein
MMHPAFVPADSVAQEFATFTFISQQSSANGHPLLFQFHGEHLGNLSRGRTIFGIRDQQLSLALTHVRRHLFAVAR